MKESPWPGEVNKKMLELPTAQVSGAGALDGDDSCAETFAVRDLSGGVDLPTFIGALEERLQRERARGGQQGTHGSPPQPRDVHSGEQKKRFMRNLLERSESKE
ncbi:UNVERIFIED_CONTAM: hypothetical protein K2H54_046206 [Gekko kuhli]